MGTLSITIIALDAATRQIGQERYKKKKKRKPKRNVEKTTPKRF